MRDPSDGQVRCEVRSWLRRAIRFGSLAHLPADYDPDGSGRGREADAHARSLLAALTDPARAQGSVAQVVAEARAFREWVESRLRASRRRLMTEARPGWVDLDRLVEPCPSPTVPPPTPKPPPHLRPVKEPNPLWDRWLDG